MAKYWEDWSGSTIDAEPTGWTKRFGTSNTTFTVLADGSSPTGRILRVGKAANQRSLLSRDDVDSDSERAKCKIRVLMRVDSIPTASNTFGAAGARGSGSAGSETMVVGALGTPSGSSTTTEVRTFRYSAGTASTIVTDGPAGVTAGGQWVWVGLDCDGTATNVEARLPADMGTITAETTDTTDITAAGWLGVFTFANAGQPFDIAAVAIATGDDDAFYEDPAAVDPPAGTVTISDVTPGVTTAQVTYSYDDTDEDSFEYRIDEGTPAAIGASPATITGLTAETTYNSPGVQVRAVNAGGESAWSTAVDFTTGAATTTVKGVRIRLYDGATPQATVTGVTAAWWDAAAPANTTPDFYTTTAATDSDGWLELDLDAATALDLTDPGYLLVWKEDGTDVLDSLGWQGILTVIDIANE